MRNNYKFLTTVYRAILRFVLLLILFVKLAIAKSSLVKKIDNSKDSVFLEKFCEWIEKKYDERFENNKNFNGLQFDFIKDFLYKKKNQDNFDLNIVLQNKSLINDILYAMILNHVFIKKNNIHKYTSVIFSNKNKQYASLEKYLENLKNDDIIEKKKNLEQESKQTQKTNLEKHSNHIIEKKKNLEQESKQTQGTNKKEELKKSKPEESKQTQKIKKLEESCSEFINESFKICKKRDEIYDCILLGTFVENFIVTKTCAARKPKEEQEKMLKRAKIVLWYNKLVSVDEKNYDNGFTHNYTKLLSLSYKGKNPEKRIEAFNMKLSRSESWKKIEGFSNETEIKTFDNRKVVLFLIKRVFFIAKKTFAPITLVNDCDLFDYNDAVSVKNIIVSFFSNKLLNLDLILYNYAKLFKEYSLTVKEQQDFIQNTFPHAMTNIMKRMMCFLFGNTFLQHHISEEGDFIEKSKEEKFIEKDIAKISTAIVEFAESVFLYAVNPIDNNNKHIMGKMISLQAEFKYFREQQYDNKKTFDHFFVAEVEKIRKENAVFVNKDTQNCIKDNWQRILQSIPIEKKNSSVIFASYSTEMQEDIQKKSKNHC